MRTRDTQRSKVYSAEQRLFPQASLAPVLSQDEITELIRRASRRFHTSQPSLRWKLHSGWTGVYGRYSYSTPGRITFYNQCTERTLQCTALHEYAHHLCSKTYGRHGVAGHGPEFVRCLVEVMKWAGYFKGRFSMGKAKIRIALAGPFWEACRLRQAMRRSH